MISTFQVIMDVLEGELGLIIFIEDNNDFSISDYIIDSIVFIQFIIAIEEKLGRELSDDFLDYESLNSAKGFAEKLNCFLEMPI